MNISDILERSKRFIATFRHEGFLSVIARIPRDVIIVIILILISATSFGIGVLYSQQKAHEHVFIETFPMAKSKTSAYVIGSSKELPIGGQVVASKNGSRYYFPWCGGVKRLSNKTKIWFSSAKEARLHGYAPAKNCKGLSR